MNKRFIVFSSGLLIFSSMIGCSTPTYQYNQRDADLGVEVMKQSLRSDYENESLVFCVFDIMIRLNQEEDKDASLFIASKNAKENDDMTYGMFKYASTVYKKAEKMSTEEYVETFRLHDGDEKDIKEMQQKTSPILKDMAVIIDRIIAKEDFNGTIADADLEESHVLLKEYQTYFQSYFRNS